MPQFHDLESEFDPIKECPPDAWQHDKFLLRLKNEKRLRTISKTNYAFSVQSDIRHKNEGKNGPPAGEDSPKVHIPQGRQHTQKSQGLVCPPPKRRKLFLSGKKELAEYLAKKEESNPKTEEQKQTESLGRKRTHLLLVPVDEASRKGILEKLKRKYVGLDESQPVAIDSDNIIEGSTDESVHSEYNSSRSSKESSANTGPGDSNHATDEHVSMAGSGASKYATDEHEFSMAGSSSFHAIEVSDDSDVSDQDPVQFSMDAKNSLSSQKPAFDHNFSLQQLSVPRTEEDVTLMKSIVLAQVNGNSFANIAESSLMDTYRELYSTLDRTLGDSESHTALLIGPRGSGKTFALHRALEVLANKYKDTFIAVRLSGSLHNSDQHAIREIARQLDAKLKSFMPVSNENTFEQRAISDTFHNILLTLNVSDTQAGSEPRKEAPIRVVFIIDEVDKFTESPKQTLLYNLLDLTQTSKVPISVIGVTTKITIRELFEKRVRSRFSQRIILRKLPSSLEDFWQDVRLSLIVPSKRFDEFSNTAYPASWNSQIEALYRQGTALTRLVYESFYITKSYRQINNSCAVPFSKITAEEPFPRQEDFCIYSKTNVDCLESVLSSLSAMQLILVVSAARWVAKSDTPQVNFKLAYKEYLQMMKSLNTEATTLSSKTSYIDNMSLAGIKVTRSVYTAKVLRPCWSSIYRTGILFDVITSNNEINANNNTNMYKEIVLDDSKMLQLDVSLEELGRFLADNDNYSRFTRL